MNPLVPRVARPTNDIDTLVRFYTRRRSASTSSHASSITKVPTARSSAAPAIRGQSNSRIGTA
ncbi:glyoxalase/bleomycin resistance /dioxygenase domain protein [Burkholderia thailandensis 34]|nr:glyoxalase/bleomycin resistance /dioxygenase domain protein [Burkholderia thailandensis 34]